MKIIDISKCNEEVISYINELQNKYAELGKINKELDKSNITIFEENNYLIKENRRLNSIINNIENDLLDRYYGRGKYHLSTDIIGIPTFYKRIKELKEGDKE